MATWAAPVAGGERGALARFVAWSISVELTDAIVVDSSWAWISHQTLWPPQRRCHSSGETSSLLTVRMADKSSRVSVRVALMTLAAEAHRALKEFKKAKLAVERRRAARLAQAV